jgi:hypothetical protein
MICNSRRHLAYGTIFRNCFSMLNQDAEFLPQFINRGITGLFTMSSTKTNQRKLKIATLFIIALTTYNQQV